ncbi:DUF6461 domain-containing protein [Lentzea sp. NBRC 102530]|uniref:DUF6461 domain-containing protein n=1 Tax=Lentzea sp. NBRC 102530 TaxID=3032201 RepID=UPI0024A22F02|nr:DUF6461 domain-containing protein [Lentzea sp. NBRC 102530]GLY48770.1 hypothetical protein Lesp01_24260 [Lentzea sp. NBRC 102530]
MGDFRKLIEDTVPRIEALIPADPAALIGRYTTRRTENHGWAVPMLQQALQQFPSLPAERLLGALELAVAGLDLTAPADMVTGLTTPPNGAFGIMSFEGQSALSSPTRLVLALHRGIGELVVRHVRAAVPDQSGITGDEDAIVVQRGRAHLATAVVVARAVLNAVGTPFAKDPVAAVGFGIAATAEIIPDVPMPAAYTQALLEKRRRDYIGMSWPTKASVSNHQFALAEQPGEAADFGATGLAAPIESGFAVRTGIEEGEVDVSVRTVMQPPEPQDLEPWDEVVEISYTAVHGDAKLGHGSTAPWPGEFRARVCASGRDDDGERYELTIWQAPQADPAVHKATDRVGHALRGEPLPPALPRPDRPYRWIEEELPVAATVTIVTGLDVDDVVGHFDGDSFAIEVDGGVLVVEHNNYQGSNAAVLEHLSRNGKAASHYWNVNRLTRLSFARGGHLLGACEAMGETDFGDDPEVLEALRDIDFTDWRHTDAKGVAAAVRFTGTAIPEADVRAAIQDSVQ